MLKEEWAKNLVSRLTIPSKWFFDSHRISIGPGASFKEHHSDLGCQGCAKLYDPLCRVSSSISETAPNSSLVVVSSKCRVMQKAHCTKEDEEDVVD